jgi:TonB family protein
VAAVLLVALLSGAMMLTGALAQTPQARFFGRLTNGDGNAIPNAVIVLCNASANLWFITSTDATGSFELAELPANKFAVEVLSPQWRRPTRNPGRDQVWGFSPWADSFTLQSGQSVQRNIRLGGLVQQPRPSLTSPPCTPRRPFSVLSADGLAKLRVQHTVPVYPQDARDANIEDRLTLEAFMNKDGKVISLRLLAPSWPPPIDPLLTRAAVEAVRDWRYRPPQPARSRDEVFEFGGQIAVEFAHDR